MIESANKNVCCRWYCFSSSITARFKKRNVYTLHIKQSNFDMFPMNFKVSFTYPCPCGLMKCRTQWTRVSNIFFRFNPDSSWKKLSYCWSTKFTIGCQLQNTMLDLKTYCWTTVRIEQGVIYEAWCREKQGGKWRICNEIWRKLLGENIERYQDMKNEMDSIPH